MQSLKDLGVLMKTGYRLFYGDCISIKHTLDRIEEYSPKEYSIFVWHRDNLKCLRYVKNGIPDASWKQSYNLQHGNVSLSRVLQIVRVTADGGALPDHDIPQKSIIVLMHAEKDLELPDVKTLLGYATSCPNWANSGLHFFVYSDNPICSQFLQQHGMELRIPPLSEGEIEAFLEMRLKTSRDQADPDLFLKKPAIVSEIVKNTIGLPPEELDSIIDWGFVLHKHETDPQVFRDHIAGIQAKVIENSDVLSFMPDDEALTEDQIGGFGSFMEAMRETRAGLTDEARATGLGIPKGVVLVGFPGTGKTMASRIIGRILGLKTIRFDIASIFGSFLGESEAKMKKALRQIEDYGKCMVYIDDADKVCSGATGGSATEGSSSTIKRVLGMLFSWLNDNTAGAYIVMTMNNKDDLPTEFLRACRFDKIYFVGLPTRNARKYILQKNLEKINLALSTEEWDRLLDETQLYTGAELVQMVKEAVWYSLYKRGTTIPTLDEIILKAKKGNHIVQSNPEAIIRIRNSWGPYLTRVDDEENLEEIAFIREWEANHSYS